MNAVRNVAASFRTGSAPPPDGDFNRDGWVDLLWGNRVSGALYSWYLKSAAMLSGNYLTPNGLADVSWQVVAVADLDQNGHTDLLWRNSVTGDLGAWFMNGTAQVRSVSSPVTLPGSGSASGPGALSWEVRGVADFTGDRKVDILWRNSVTGDLWVSINGTTPTGAYLNPRRESSLNQQIGGVADFDNDGRLDLVWHDRSTGDLKIWLMTGTTAARYATPTPARLAAPWRLLRAADYNNDGKPDLLFENGTTRELLVWYMNGTARATQGYVNPSKSSTADWRVVPR
jgi:hypothetical protein